MQEQSTGRLPVELREEDRLLYSLMRRSRCGRAALPAPGAKPVCAPGFVPSTSGEPKTCVLRSPAIPQVTCERAKSICGVPSCHPANSPPMLRLQALRGLCRQGRLGLELLQRSTAGFSTRYALQDPALPLTFLLNRNTPPAQCSAAKEITGSGKAGAAWGFATLAAGGAAAYTFGSQAVVVEARAETPAAEPVPPVEKPDPYLLPTAGLKGLPKEVIVYQYEVCPFCCKVKAFLDYHKVSQLRFPSLPHDAPILFFVPSLCRAAHHAMHGALTQPWIPAGRMALSVDIHALGPSP